MSTEAAAAPFDLDRGWRVAAQVAIRPERFGALLYHFGTRRLSFVKSPALCQVLLELDATSTARQACERAGVPQHQLARFEQALGVLAGTHMIERGP